MKIEEHHIIDWYDGIVQAITRTDPEGTWYYCCLLAWSMAERLKAFGLVELSASWSDRFLEVLASVNSSNKLREWSIVTQTVRQFIDEVQGEMLVILCRDLDESIMVKKRLDICSFKADLGLSIDRVLEPKRINRWLSLLGREDHSD